MVKAFVDRCPNCITQKPVNMPSAPLRPVVARALFEHLQVTLYAATVLSSEVSFFFSLTSLTWRRMLGRDDVIDLLDFMEWSDSATSRLRSRLLHVQSLLCDTTKTRSFPFCLGGPRSKAAHIHSAAATASLGIWITWLQCYSLELEFILESVEIAYIAHHFGKAMMYLQRARGTILRCFIVIINEQDHLSDPASLRRGEFPRSRRVYVGVWLQSVRARMSHP